MRIKSKFKDCYDNLQSQSLPLYIRETSVEHLPLDECFNFRDPNNVHGCIVGFCGEVYFAYYQTIENDSYQRKVFYTPESLLEHFPTVVSKENWSRWGEGSKRDFLEYRKSQFGEYFGYDLPTDVKNKFKKHFSITCPVWIIKSDGYNYTTGRDNCYIIKNPNCRHYELYKLFPVQKMFQEIEMYLGGLASPDKKIPAVSDSDMIVAKGFDNWSFRKEPTKAKKRS